MGEAVEHLHARSASSRERHPERAVISGLQRLLLVVLTSLHKLPEGVPQSQWKAEATATAPVSIPARRLPRFLCFCCWL